MTYEEILSFAEKPARLIVDHGGEVHYRYWPDEDVTIQLRAEGTKVRLRVWDLIGGRVRDEVIVPSDVHSRFSIEIHLAHTARLN